LGELDRLELTFADADALKHAYEAQLRRRRAVVPGFSFVELYGECTVVLRRADSGDQLELPARVVAIDHDPPGIGVELLSVDGLEAFAEAAAPSPGAPAVTAPAHDRLRHLRLHEQQKLARGGELSDRVALERMFGKNVWEALLQNPRLTIPEVARIARKGTVPKPLLDRIVDNKAWIKAPPVRRALLSNPRLGTDALMPILKLTPKRELKLIQKQMGYPAAVREAARKLFPD